MIEDINKKVDEEIIKISIEDEEIPEKNDKLSLISKILFATSLISMIVTAYFAYQNSVSLTIFGCTAVTLNWISFRDSIK